MNASPAYVVLRGNISGKSSGLQPQNLAYKVLAEDIWKILTHFGSFSKKWTSYGRKSAGKPFALFGGIWRIITIGSAVSTCCVAENPCFLAAFGLRDHIFGMQAAMYCKRFELSVTRD